MKYWYFFLLLFFTHHTYAINKSIVFDQIDAYIQEKIKIIYPNVLDVNTILRSRVQFDKLSLCPIDLVIKDTNIDLGRRTVMISCLNSENYWQAKVFATIHITHDVIVSKKNLKRNSVIKASDLTLEPRKLFVPKMYFFNKNALVKKKLKHSIRKNEIIVDKHIALDYAVKKGQAITMQLKHNHVFIEAQGIALENGMQGETIKVKNSTSNKILYGIIVSAHSVLIK